VFLFTCLVTTSRGRVGNSSLEMTDIEQTAVGLTGVKFTDKAADA